MRRFLPREQADGYQGDDTDKGCRNKAVDADVDNKLEDDPGDEVKTW